MQVSLTNHKSTESAIKNLEVQVGQLAKQLAEKSSSTFGANIEQNPKRRMKGCDDPRKEGNHGGGEEEGENGGG